MKKLDIKLDMDLIEDIEDKIFEINKIVSDFADEVRRHIDGMLEKYEDGPISDEIEFTISCNDDKHKLALTEGDADCALDYMDNAIDFAFPYHDSEHGEIETESTYGYVRKPFYWLRMSYFRCAGADFDIRFKNGKIILSAECHVYFSAKDDGDCSWEIDRAEYIDGVSKLITDEKNIKAIEKKIHSEKLTREEKSLLETFEDWGDREQNDNDDDDDDDGCYWDGYGSEAAFWECNGI